MKITKHTTWLDRVDETDHSPSVNGDRFYTREQCLPCDGTVTSEVTSLTTQRPRTSESRVADIGAQNELLSLLNCDDGHCESSHVIITRDIYGHLCMSECAACLVN